ncbi:Hypothetical predicted protein [Xyrichtys novacula]|uniref:Uncharacterized protein n=1 Tax=Xyrichtys novacula TaxID=13765 RepID=A0AAV1FAS5_XYRNO|nr:Hypothetical predicted protein [Xyrichtys novacula]
MESPTIKVVGGKSGRGDCVTGEKYVGGGGELAEKDIGDETGGTGARRGASVKLSIERHQRDPVCGWLGMGGGRDGGELEDP